MKPRGGDEPVPLHESLRAVGRELGLADTDALRRLLEAWPEIVGPALAPHVQLRSLRDGVLTLAVDAPPWATQLRYLETEVLERVEVAVGSDAAKALRIVVAQPS